MDESLKTNRRLAAILSADVVSYSRMMASDELRTLAALKHHRETVFNPAVARYKGRIVKLMGDGTLVEFASVVDAVKCAIDIQQTTASPPSDVTLRIGINLGDIIIDDDDIYGDGVNVAARLEPLAPPGGICISAIVHDSVGNRVDAVFADGGEVSVKNIALPVRVWTWRPKTTAAPASPADIIRTDSASADAEPLGEPPAIAVLPFDNMSGDPDQEYFSDGITEDIITDLSKVAGLMVIARNSSFTYKGKSTDIRTVGRQLGVTAVLEGSIRRAGSRVRVTAQLIDAKSGMHLWAERYDRDMTDIFAVQDDVTTSIVEALKVKLTPAETARIAEVPTTSIEAHDLFLQGREALFSTENNKAAFERSVSCFTRAIGLDPDYADAYAGLAHAYNHDFQNNWSGRADGRDLSAHYSRLALEKGPHLPYPHYVAGLVKSWERNAGDAAREVEAALALNPNFVLAVALRGFLKIYNGRPLDALPDLEHALRLDPLVKHLYWHFIGSAYLVAQQYGKAAEAFRERIRLSPRTDLSRGLLVSALGHLGEAEEARRIWAELKELKPGYSFAAHIARLPFADPADAERITRGFVQAGLAD